MVALAPEMSHATVDDLLAIPEAERFHEILGGELIRKAMPSLDHGVVQTELSFAVVGPYGRGRGGPGGWVFASETEVVFSPTDILRPDLCGWKRERLAAVPKEWPVRVAPDWVCEILSPSNAQNDLFKKILVYQRAHVGHYWILDPVGESLAVYRWTPEGFLLVAVAQGDERFRLEPFDAVEISVRELVTGTDLATKA
jgi:Uma2 family endonuclease